MWTAWRWCYWWCVWLQGRGKIDAVHDVDVVDEMAWLCELCLLLYFVFLL